MAARAVHLVDEVFPDVAVRQWVLSLPHRIRYLLAWDHALCRAVVGVYLRAVLGFLRRRAYRDGVADGRSGAVAIIQRVGGALNLNVHDLHAGLVVSEGRRDRLEQVCRYALRPPIAEDRLQRAADGQLWLALRHRWADGTTHLRFDPLELLERLAALTPRPRINLILYFGVRAPRARWRAEVVAYIPSGDVRDRVVTVTPRAEEADRSGAVPRRSGALLWADLMRRTFGFDVLACPRCGGRMRLIALIDQAAVLQRILRPLGLPSDLPEPHPARAPPIPPEDAALGGQDDTTVDPCS